MANIDEAFRTGDLETIRRLLKEDPDLVNADDEHQWKPIFHAAFLINGLVENSYNQLA